MAEVNRVGNAADGTVDNFGWPCAVGSGANSSYAGTAICQGLAASPAVQAPALTYTAGQPLFSGDTCQTASGSEVTGVAFAGPGAYPASHAGALFLADRLRRCVWAVPVSASGQPSPGASVPVLSTASNPVNLKPGPGGELFYADPDGGTIRRLTYASGNQPPTAIIQAGPATSGPSPLVVNFNAAASTDPEGGALTYAWDLDGDGAFDDATNAQTTFTYAGSGRHPVLLRVQDPQGLSHVAALDIITDNTAPVAVISAPTAAVNWSVGQTVTFSGSATDTEDGVLPASRLSWSLIANHCPSTCHTHPLQDFIGVSGGSFVAPDHEYPSHLELRLTATDNLGVQSTTSVLLQPRTVDLTFASSPAGLQLTVGTTQAAAPFTRTVIVGSSNPVSAPSPQATWTFAAWSDGGSSSHTIVAPPTAQTYTATFQAAPTPPPGLVAAYGFNEGTGTVVQSAVGSFAGTVSGATWTATGKYGPALSFNGTSAMVTVADANALDLTTGMTLEAWVFPTAATGVRDILIKEGTGVDIYNLYARNGAGQLEATVFAGGANRWATGAVLPLSTWTHVAATYNGTTIRLYVNGVQVGTTAFTGVIGTSTGALRIGGNSLWGEFFQGQIDEVRIYNRALTAAELLTDMNTPVSGAVQDTTPPQLSAAQPTGTLPAGTTQTTLSLTSNEAATCRYATTPGVAYASMTSTFSSTGGTSHATTVTGLINGGSYVYYVRCKDELGNVNPNDFPIAFSVAASSATTSTFVGVQSPLSENGVWDSPGAWADLQKNNGAFATTGLGAAARRVSPLVGADQYAEIVYDQDPGASSWVGVMTRVQGAANGSGYLAIAYAGEVRLYRTDDTGALNFTLLASASAQLGSAPRRLRLESAGDTHRVYFNGALVISHGATGVVYSSGQPGIAASVFGGPQVKILSFEGGDLDAPTMPALAINNVSVTEGNSGTANAVFTVTPFGGERSVGDGELRHRHGDRDGAGRLHGRVWHPHLCPGHDEPPDSGSGGR